MPLAELVGREIETNFQEGEEKALAQMVSHPGIGVALISWEHTRIPAIAKNLLDVANPEAIPVSVAEQVRHLEIEGSGHSTTLLPATTPRVASDPLAFAILREGWQSG